MNTHDPSTGQEHTTVIRSDQEVASVTFAPRDDGRWFRILNSVIDRGEWAALSNAARNVLVVLARYAGQDGTSFPDAAALKSASGLSRSAIYEALGELERNAELIGRGPGGRGWVIFPGRTFATRAPHAARDVGRSPSAPADSLHELRRRQSARLDESSATVDKSSAPADSPSELRLRQDVVDRVLSVPTGGGAMEETDDDDEFKRALIQRLISEGRFARIDAERFVEAHGEKQASDALENALYEHRHGRIRKSIRAACWHFATRGMPLFDHVASELEARRATEAAGELREILAAHLDRESSALVTRVFGNCRRAMAFGAVSIADVRSRPDPDVARLVREAALVCVGNHESQFKRLIATSRLGHHKRPASPAKENT